jgi:hypothetical protein
LYRVVVHCSIYQGSYNISILLEFTPSTFPLYPLIGEIVSTDIFFPFTFMCTQYLHHIHPLIPFPHLLPPPTGNNTPRQSLFCPPVPQFCKKKGKRNDIFACLRQLPGNFRVALICMYYSPLWFISPIILFSTLVPFLWLFQPV